MAPTLEAIRRSEGSAIGLRNAWAVASVQNCVAYGTLLVLLAGAMLCTGFPVLPILVLWNYGPYMPYVLLYVITSMLLSRIRGGGCPRPR
ncbi:MAG: hypothetical protein K2N48_06985 [Muribaculaceae bacterium]|nr:hypothetical protein [Muribaculaceae bacterium]